jgi:hypothetical protein
MSSILTFRLRKKPATTPKQNAAPAKIIIFPGVRYEHRDAAQPAPNWRPATWITPPLPTV